MWLMVWRVGKSEIARMDMVHTQRRLPQEKSASLIASPQPSPYTQAVTIWFLPPISLPLTPGYTGSRGKFILRGIVFLHT